MRSDAIKLISDYPDASARSFCWREALDQFGLKPKGIIHVGMSEPRLIDRYLDAGFNSIVVVEADPICFQRLVSQPAKNGVCIVHAAAAGSDGVAYLNRTELVGCSSLLEFRKHLEIYPHLLPADRVQVPVRTLDRLFKELHLDPVQFNALALDAQGSERMVLEGAVELLEYVEIICTEVYRDEIYAGVTRHEVLDAGLQGAGFNCAALRYPWHEAIGSALYLRRPVLSMSSFGRNGRFANQLFQYLFLRMTAKIQRMCLQIPAWTGRDLFGLDEPPILTGAMQVLVDGGAMVSPELNVFSNPETLITGGRVTLPNTDVWGYFQFNMRAYEPHRDFIRDLYTPRGSIGGLLAAGVEKVRLLGKKIIGVHLRRGDYGHGIFFRAPCAWYEKWVHEMNFDPSQYLIFICSEDASKYVSRFPGYQVLTADTPGFSWELDAALFDFHILCESDVLAISNSSFSFMASLLNKRCRHFFRPCSQARALQAFEPWESEPLVRSELSEEEHQALIKLD